MAKRTDSTHPIYAPGGPVSVAVRAVRQPVTPSFAPLHGHELTHGYHLARRRTWASDQGWHLVFVYVQSDADGTRLGVFQVGSVEPDDPAEWVFRSRVVGLDLTSEDTIELEAVDVSGVMH